MRRRQQVLPMKVFIAMGNDPVPHENEPYVIGVFTDRDVALQEALARCPKFGVVEEWVLR